MDVYDDDVADLDEEYCDDNQDNNRNIQKVEIKTTTNVERKMEVMG